MPLGHARRGRAFLALLAAACVAPLIGCVPSVSLPATCGDPTVALSPTLANDRLDPATLEVCRGQEVTITVTPEQDGLLHLHGYDDLLSVQEVRAGQEVELAFPATHVGQFPIALHPPEGPAELTVGTLVVHDA